MSEKRKQALRELDGELSQLSRNLVNAGYLAQDIMEDYFEGIDATADKGPYLLAYEHPRYLSKKEHKQICASYGTEVLAGHRVIPLPEVEKTYSANEVGKMLGISANKVGHIANQNGLKTRENGYYALDKSAYSGKEVETFRYNERGIEAVKQYL